MHVECGQKAVVKSCAHSIAHSRDKQQCSAMFIRSSVRHLGKNRKNQVLCYSTRMPRAVTEKNTSPVFYSIGHGNRSCELFLALLSTLEIAYLADIRSYPRSRRNPHFNRENLELTLDKAGITYTWWPDLGGFRREGLGNKSPHVALQSVGFRNYADYLSSNSFLTAAQRLTQLASLGPACFMCAETLPQRCHRFLLSDFLVVQGIKVIHILDNQRTTVHELSPLATLREGRIVYNRVIEQQLELEHDD